MRESGFNHAVFDEHRAFITSDAARKAYDLLTGHALALPDYQCLSVGRGQQKKYFRYRRNGGDQPFAFIVNRANLLFYIRPAGLATSSAAVRELEQVLPGRIGSNPAGEVTIRVDSAAAAAEVVRCLFAGKAQRQV